MAKTKLTPEEQVKYFWESNDNAVFNEEIISNVRDVSAAKLRNERFEENGPPYRKIGGHILYVKRDVVNWIESFPLKGNKNDIQENTGSAQG